MGISFADDRDAIGFSFSLSPMIVMLILIAQSYGGFMSSKVVEANAGIHSLAMAVAVRLFLFRSRHLWNHVTDDPSPSV